MILIDDVDMSLDKGVQILDVVRGYMASPLAIPVISGDIDLYNTRPSTIMVCRGPLRMTG